MEDSLSLTEQLRRFSDGDRAMADAVLRQILPELHRIAVRELRREAAVAPLTPTELINEVWLSSLRKGAWEIHSRAHFYSVAALAMRRVLVDFARKRLAQRRGDRQVSFSIDDSGTELSVNSSHETVVEIGVLMERMDKENGESARVVDLHYFAGFTLEEIAEHTGLTLRQVRHRWEKGRDWLKDRMSSS